MRRTMGALAALAAMLSIPPRQGKTTSESATLDVSGPKVETISPTDHRNPGYAARGRFYSPEGLAKRSAKLARQRQAHPHKRRKRMF